MKSFAFALLVFITAPLARADGEGAASRPQNFSIFLAAGSALSPGSVRLGFGSWEFGFLTKEALGAAKQAFFKEDLYAVFGFGKTVSAKPAPLIIGGIGWEKALFWRLYFRAEMNAMAATNVHSSGGLLAGINTRF